ncbi:MAG: adenylate/guanylate cyclase domain-containing protein [Acidimicrobiia bacterium]|nr:adenylate/guanylate cyclase domain-containing protein [Acidimicrobiia bacterium]
MPSGTVTFLFTDIEGSTRLWAEHPAEMRAALKRHDGLLKKTVSAHEGHVVKSTGDGIYAVFARAQSAAAAAVAAQAAFQSERLEGIGSLKVRMALHTGEADERDGDYFGAALNRAARLLGAGNGGQILVSNVTKEVLADQDLQFLDLGMHRLRDIPNPEHIHQLLYPGAKREFSPLRSLDAQPNNLPIELTSFIGRENEVDEVSELLSNRRLVTLTGVGGTGKTRLATRVARDVLGIYPDGAWFVGLASIADADLVVGHVAAPFGVREIETYGDRGLLDVLCDYLQDKTLLLVLDNCEHVLEQTSAIVEQIVTRCPAVRVLATSRGLLGVPGEAAYPVPPLGLAEEGSDKESEAIRLFVERAASVRPGFVLDDETADAVAGITRQLDGLPLAIELAASRINLLAPSEILGRLDNQLRVVASRRGKGRHSTLEAAIDWSYDLLSESDREVFACLAVFAGGWDLGAAVAISGNDELDVLESLDHLVDQSLVEVSDLGSGRRYRLLEPVRQYAAAKLAAASNGYESYVRHADYFAVLAEEGRAGLRGTDQEEWLLRLEAEHDNVRAAIDWCLDKEDSLALRITAAMGWFWWLRGYWPEALRWFWKVYGATPESDPLLRARLVYGVALIEVMRVRPDDVAPLFTDALDIVERLGTPIDLAWVRAGLGEIGLDPDLAKAAMDGFEAAGDTWATSYTKFLYGQALFFAGDVNGILEMERSVEELLGLKDRLTAAWLGFVLGHTMAFKGRLRDARRLIVQSRDLVDSSTDRWIGPHCASRLGILATMEGRFEEARELFEEALPVHMRIGDQNCTALVHTFMGELMTGQGDLKAALSHLGKGITGYEDLNNATGVANGLRRMAWLAQARGDSHRAVVLLGASDALAQKSGGRVSAHDEERLSSSISQLRADLREEDFDAAWREGSGATREEMLTYALGRQAP